MTISNTYSKISFFTCRAIRQTGKLWCQQVCSSWTLSKLISSSNSCTNRSSMEAKQKQVELQCLTTLKKSYFRTWWTMLASDRIHPNWTWLSFPRSSYSSKTTKHNLLCTTKATRNRTHLKLALKTTTLFQPFSLARTSHLQVNKRSLNLGWTTNCLSHTRGMLQSLWTQIAYKTTKVPIKSSCSTLEVKFRKKRKVATSWREAT